MKKILYQTPVLFFVLSIQSLTAQTGLPAYSDNALKYNRLMIEKTGEGVYKMISVFKVIGTSYLFGERNKGNLFSPEAKAYNISLSYNTYNQQIEFYSTANPDKPLIKEPGEVDSFSINSNAELGLPEAIKFVYGSHLGSSDKSYFMEIYAGKNYGVYKKYKSDLGYVSSNYVQSELRQFDLLYEYYYYNSEKKSLKKLKTNASSIIKELKDIKDISPAFTVDDFTLNQDAALRKAFEYLNQ